MKDYMPKDGVKELRASQSGRNYLAKLQKKYRNDILQSNDPEFHKRYGNKLEVQRRQKEQSEQRAKDEWQERKEKKDFKNREVGLRKCK